MRDTQRLRRRLGAALVASAMAAGCQSSNKPTPPPPPPDDHRLPSCPSGDWCGPKSEVAKVAPSDAGDACPKSFHSGEKKKVEGTSIPPYKSFNLDEAATAKKGGDACCYTWVEPCPGGRPLLDEHGAPAWQGARGQAPTWLAAAWMDDAIMEHASIASFERAAAELDALGAPTELVLAHRKAAADEAEHAAMCAAEARRHGAAFAFPAQDAHVRPGDLSALAVRTFVEGCIGESIAALCAGRAAEECSDAATRAMLETIADDEADHAALAWRTLAWALAAGGAPARRALEEAAARWTVELDAMGGGEPIATFEEGRGRLSSEARRTAREDAWREVIAPLLATLV